ncbi:helicase [Aureococcus anophagefferens]|nr:helicase [Aureococcus anophagefferens]
MLLKFAVLFCGASALLAPQTPCRARPRTRVGASFVDLAPELPGSLVAALRERNIVAPTPIQEAAVGPLLGGASAMLAAETGSGKSVAFLLPTVARLEALDAGGDVAAAVLVLAPTRELALQLAADAAGIVGDESKVQLLVVGAATTADALKARAVVATPARRSAFSAYKVLGKKAAAFGAVVLDEVDALLPPKRRTTAPRARRSARRRKKKKQLTEKRQAANSPAEDVLRFVVKANPRPELQVVAASATASRDAIAAVRARQDPYGRWSEAPLDLFRVGEAEAEQKSRSVVVPSCVAHRYATVEKGASLDVTMRRVAKAAEALAPTSALVFLSAASGFTVKDAVSSLDKAGVPAEPLHSALNLDKRAVKDAAPGPTDLRAVLDGGHARVAGSFAAAASGAASAAAPVFVTFEDSARGLHFDGVDAVFSVGLPATPASYLHVAGRTGRRLGGETRPGTVVTVLPPKAVPILESWSNQLGDVAFEEL